MPEAQTQAPPMTADTPIDRSNLKAKGFVPGGVYTVWVKNLNQTPAKTGTLQDVLTLEILAPDKKKFGDAMYDTGGVEVETRIFYTKDSMKRTLDVLRKLGLPEVDTAANVGELQAATKRHFERLSFDIPLASRERIMRMQLTPAQVAAGKFPSDADPVLDSKGKPVSNGWELFVNLDQIRPGSAKHLEGRPSPF